MATDARLTAFLTDGCEVFSSVQQGQALWQPDPFDVESMNAQARRAFERLVQRATRRAPPPDSGKLLLVLGESGSGKTHLVRAFRNGVHGKQQGYVGYVPMTVDAAHYDRHVLSNLITSLDHSYASDQGEDSGLTRLSDAMMKRCSSAFAPLIPAEQILDEEELHGVIHSVADELHADPNFSAVDVSLLRALLYLQRRDARFHHRVLQWLRCEDLSPADRKVLGELVPRTADDDPGRMMEHLGLLMGVLGQALVICVDQMEDISDFEQNPRMEPSCRRAMSSLAALAGRVPTAVVVVCCLTDFWTKMRAQLNQAMIDRIENDPEPVELDRLVSAATARDIAARRLSALYAQRQAKPDAADPTYPFPVQGFEKLAGFRARDVLNECRRYRDRAIQDGKLPETFPLVRPARPGTEHPLTPPVTPSPLGQVWIDFKANFKAQVPDQSADIAALLAWAIELGGHELGGPPRFAVRARDGESLEVFEKPAGRELFVALCNKSSRGGHLSKQMAEALRAAAGKVPILVRTTDFPSTLGNQVAEQTSLLLKRGGRRAVIADSDMRELVALQAFRQAHPEQAFLDWTRQSQPITRLKSISDMLGLERLAGQSGAQAAARAPAPTTKRADVQVFEQQRGTFGKPPGLTPNTRRPDAAPRSPQDLDEVAFSGDFEAMGHMLTSHPPEPRKPHSDSTPVINQPIARIPLPDLVTGPLQLGVTEGLLSEPLTMDVEDLTRHCAFLGGTGSGKTTLALSVVEQLLLQGIPALLLDRKGDLASYAKDEAWREKLDVPFLEERRRLLRERVDVALYTPGRSDGRPLAMPLVPRGLEQLPPEEQEQGLQQAADALASMLEYKNNPRDRASRALLSQAIRLLTHRAPQRELSLGMIHELVESMDPTLVQEAKGLDPKLFPKLSQDIATLRMNKRTLLSSTGEKLDLEELLGRGPGANSGRTRLSIVSTKFLGDTPNVLFWVSQLLQEANRWASQHPSPRLQATILFDEADLYLPAVGVPATKPPMENLLRRARSAGVGVLLATQSPGDFDYKCRENVRTWFVGCVREERAIGKLRPMFSEAKVDASQTLPPQRQGQFHLLRDGQVRKLKADRSVMRTEQLPEDEILRLARRTQERQGK
ncbi:DUF853 family protein [Corallococcus sp. M34]|uniref:ATP-binding protein n=1 Tax=Citreicoccus inhibens TaxID=2849499 RepID=UPI001C223AA9|nr:DUF87 domain-containing protein [Citreicoccus inhibens]MBU8894141.1 DUF853 family protein [Citreicoccus inhibens]